MAVAVQHPSLPPTGYMSASMHAATRDKQLPPPPAEQLHSTPAPAKITRANSRSFRPKLHTLPSAGIASSRVPSPASPTPRVRPMSSFLPRSTSATFVNAVKQPKILSALVYSIEWPDFWSFANTCRDCRRLVGSPDLTDVVLSRFVPGYAQCLRACDLEQLKKVTVTLSDLHLLCEFGDPSLNPTCSWICQICHNTCLFIDTPCTPWRVRMHYTLPQSK